MVKEAISSTNQAGIAIIKAKLKEIGLKATATKPKNIAKGINGTIKIFATGEIRENLPKFTKIIGRANICALKVIANASLIPKRSGINETQSNILFPITIRPSVARKES